MKLGLCRMARRRNCRLVHRPAPLLPRVVGHPPAVEGHKESTRLCRRMDTRRRSRTQSGRCAHRTSAAFVQTPPLGSTCHLRRANARLPPCDLPDRTRRPGFLGSNEAFETRTSLLLHTFRMASLALLFVRLNSCHAEMCLVEWQRGLLCVAPIERHQQGLEIVGR